MRNFRKAAFAGATAVAVAFGSTAVAAADTPETAPVVNETNTLPVEEITEGNGGLSTKAGNKLGAWTKDEDGNVVKTTVTKDEFLGGWVEGQTPAWAKLLFAGGIAAMVSAFVGLIVGPAYNFFVHGPAAF